MVLVQSKMSLKFILLLVCSAYIAVKIGAGTECTTSTYGTEFVFAFLDLPYFTSTSSQVDPDLSVIVTLRSSTNIYLTTYATGTASKTPVPVTKKWYVYHSKEFQFNSSFINKYQDQSQGGVIKITSDSPIDVRTVYRTSAYLFINPILPTNALSTAYIIPSYTLSTLTSIGNKFLVISLNDSTEVRFEGYETGNMVYPLAKDEIFIYQRRVDLSGTTAKSNKPVAIFSSVMSGLSGCGLQTSPIDKHSTHFIIPPLKGNYITNYNVRIYASVQDAYVTIHSTSDSTQHVHVYSKIFYEMTVDSDAVLEIVSDNPLIIEQTALGRYQKAYFMTTVPAVTQFLSSYSTSALDLPLYTPSKTFLITIPFSEASGLIINRKPLAHNPTQFAKQTPLGNFTVLGIDASTSVSTITHVNSVPFGVFVVSQWDNAYGFQAGMQFTTDCEHTDVAGSIVG